MRRQKPAREVAVNSDNRNWKHDMAMLQEREAGEHALAGGEESNER